MKTPLQKITLVFLLLAVLPVGYLIHELNSLSRNEKIVQDIYQNQLDAILFSVNQYSDDVLSSWANKINIALIRDDPAADGMLTGLNDITSIPAVYVSSLSGSNAFYRLNEDSVPVQDFRAFASYFEKSNAGEITKLLTYYEGGFRKLQPADSVLTREFVPVAFVLDQEATPFRLALVFIDLSQFLQNNLGPKMQSIAGDKFIISAYRRSDQAVAYSTVNNFTQTSDAGERADLNPEDGSRKPLWLIPGYDLGIQMKESTLDDLVKDRMQTSVVVLVFLLLILGSGIVFLYRSIRYQIRLSQAKTEFVSNVSHEIRTPLSLISMYAETLELGRVPEDKKHEYYSIISKEAARLSGIVNRILNFSKLDANKREFVFKMIDLNKVGAELIDSYSHHLLGNGFTFEFHEHRDPVMVEGDRESVGEALVNLLDNAMKYSKQKKHIIVRTGMLDRFGFIEVQDNGIGIPKAYQKDIFEQFYRAPMGNVHHTKGSGLGLTLVRKTMDAHKGKVEVMSLLDKGSTFRLCFPTLNGTAP